MNSESYPQVRVVVKHEGELQRSHQGQEQFVRRRPVPLRIQRVLSAKVSQTSEEGYFSILQGLEMGWRGWAVRAYVQNS